MANRGLSHEEIAYAKGMIELGMRRDVIHSFFVEPGNPLTPAFVSELHSGRLGRGIPAASKEATLAFIDSRIAFRNTLSRRTGNQLDLFPEPPTDIPSPHRFSWSGSKLTQQPYENYNARTDPDATTLLNEARDEVEQLLSDPALGNHPRLTRRINAINDLLGQDIALVNPVLAGARAKRVMESIEYSKFEFSDEFIGEISASMSAVLMFASHFEVWRRFELTALSIEMPLEELNLGAAITLVEKLESIPDAIVDPSVSNSVREFSEKARDQYDSMQNVDLDFTVSASLRASINYAALSTISQFAATLIREMRDSGKQATISAAALVDAIKSGAIKGTETGSKIITSSVIIIFTISQLKSLSYQYPSVLGWMKPFIEVLERHLGA